MTPEEQQALYDCRDAAQAAAQSAAEIAVWSEFTFWAVALGTGGVWAILTARGWLCKNIFS